MGKRLLWWAVGAGVALVAVVIGPEVAPAAAQLARRLLKKGPAPEGSNSPAGAGSAAPAATS